MKAVVALFCTLAAFLGVELILICIHECGHLLAGRLAGFQWRTCKIGPFQLRRDVGRWRWMQAVSWLDGFVEFSLEDNFRGRLRWIVVLLSGSVANILFALGLYAFFYHQPPRAQNGEGWLFGIATFSLLIGLINLLPFSSRSGPSDGLWLCFLCLSGKNFREERENWLRQQASVARYDAVAAIQKQLLEGMRPLSCDVSQIYDAIALRDESRSESIACFYAYVWAEDSGDAMAGKYLDRAVTLRPQNEDFGQTLVMEKAYWSALHERDAATARAWLAQVSDDCKEASTYWRALAAISLAEGKLADASQQADQARTLLTPEDPTDRYLLDCLLKFGAFPLADAALSE